MLFGKKNQGKATPIEDKMVSLTKMLIFASALIMLMEFFMLFLVAPVWTR